MLKAFLNTNQSIGDTLMANFYQTIYSGFVKKIDESLDETEPSNDDGHDNFADIDQVSSVDNDQVSSVDGDQDTTVVEENIEDEPLISGSYTNPISFSRLSNHASDLDHVRYIELSVKNGRKAEKSYRVFDPKGLPDMYKKLLTKTRKSFQKHCIFYLKKMEEVDKIPSNTNTHLGKLGFVIVIECGMCRKLCLDFSNMKKHLNTHSEAEKASHEINRQSIVDVVTLLSMKKLIPVPDFWISPRTNGFFNQILYHFDKHFVEFSALENNSYRERFSQFKKVYHVWSI